MPQFGLIQVASSDDLARKEEAERQKRVADQQSQEHITNFAAYIEKCWEIAKRAKIPIEKRLQECKLQRDGKYSPEKLSKIRAQGGSEIYMMLTNIKCRALEAWLSEVIFPIGESPFTVESSPIPDIPPEMKMEIENFALAEIQRVEAMTGQRIGESPLQRIEEIQEAVRERLKEQAVEAAEKQKREIEDDLKEGGFYNALKDFIYDFATYPFAVIKGPIIRQRKELKWDMNFNPVVGEEYKREYERVDPFNIYWSPGARNFNEGFVIEIMEFSRKQLRDLRGIEGYDSDAIDHILAEESAPPKIIRPSSFDQAVDMTKETETQSEGAEEKPEGIFEGKLFWGSVPGKYLAEWGLDDIDKDEEYEATILKVGDYIIKAVLNEHPLGHRPYFSTSYDRIPDSIPGRALPEIMRGPQDICNASARALVNNMGLASGPMVEINTDRLPPGKDIESIHPWMILQTTSARDGGSHPAVQFYQPRTLVEQLQAIFDYYFKLSSEVTGIPAYIYGSPQVGGAARTATGLSMLMNAASKGLKEAVLHIDFDVIITLVEHHHQHILLYSPERAHLGDIKVIARASSYLIEQEQMQVRLTELLKILNNPVDNQILGAAGRGEMIRKLLSVHRMPVDKIMPDEKSLVQMDVEGQIQQVLMLLSEKLGIPPEQLMMIMNTPTGASPREMTPDGRQMGGREAGLFNQ